jgi:hypothetical protein
MEAYFLERPVTTFCITADFPSGIKAAYEKLHALLPSAEERNFYGISWSIGNGKIMYKAAVEELYEGEGEQYGCESFIIRKGRYMSQLLKNWQQDEGIVAKTFMQLLATSGILKNGYCVEMYLNEKDVRCMVTLED